jgi:uncharacterized protein YhfF
MVRGMFADPRIAACIQEHPVTSADALSSLRHGTKWRTACTSEAVRLQNGDVLYVGNFAVFTDLTGTATAVGRLRAIFIHEEGPV